MDITVGKKYVRVCCSINTDRTYKGQVVKVGRVSDFYVEFEKYGKHGFISEAIKSREIFLKIFKPLSPLLEENE